MIVFAAGVRERSRVRIRTWAVVAAVGALLVPTGLAVSGQLTHAAASRVKAPAALAEPAPATSASAPASAAPGTPTPSAAPAPRAVFKHPGVLVGKDQLDVMRQKVGAGAQPWKSAYDRMRTSQYASLARKATPRAIVECGSRSNPDLGCSDEREDASAAYTDSL